MTNQTLETFSERITYIVTDLNGLISRIVNQEVTLADFNHDLTELFNQLTTVEGIVSDLEDVFWKHFDGKEIE